MNIHLSTCSCIRHNSAAVRRAVAGSSLKCCPVQQLVRQDVLKIRGQATPPDSGENPGENDSIQSDRPSTRPELPPRPPKEAGPLDAARARSSSRASSSGRGIDDLERGLLPPPPPPPSNERLLAGLLAYSGMLGTTACALAQATHIDMWGNWHWDAHDTAIAFATVAPVMVLNAAIVVPDYSNWRLPDAEALMARRERMPNSTSSTAQATASAPTGSTGESALAPGQACNPSAHVRPTAGLVRQRQPSRLQLWKDAFHLAQGMLLSNNSPASSLTPVLGASVLALNTLATELLFRSVMLQLLGGWAIDRMYEAGLDDTLPVPIHALGGAAAVGLVTATSAVALVQRAIRVARRRPLVLDLQRSFKPDGKARLVVREGTAAEPKSSAVKATPSEAGAGASTERVVLPSSGGAASAIVLSQLVQGARELLQSGSLAVAYVATGNLAAVYAAALVNTLLLASLQQWGLARTRARSLAFAQQLQQLNTKMQQRIKARDGNLAGERGAAGPPEAVTNHEATTSGDVSSAGAPAGSSVLAATPQAQRDSQACASHAPSHMAGTISLLDSLLGIEELATAADGHAGK